MLNTENHFSFGVLGMSCVSCAKRVETNINKIAGIKFVSINIATEKGYVIAENTVEAESIKKAVESAGYLFSATAPDDDIIIRKFKTAKIELFTALFFSAPLMLLMILHMFNLHISYYIYIELAVSAIVLFYCGRKILRGAVIAARHFHSNMDTLVSLSALAAFSTAAAVIAGINITSFGTLSAMLITFHLTGRYIEAKLKFKAAADIRKLLKLQPNFAMLITDSGILKISADAIKTNDIIICRNGDKIPADGIIIDGDAYIDESTLTGEPLPVYKTTGIKVLSGSIIHSGSIKIKVEYSGKDTFLNKMIKLVDEAQSIKIPMQAIADRIIIYFAPAIFFIALIGGLIWYFNYKQLNAFIVYASNFLPWLNVSYNPVSMALFVAIGVLVIACPCALGLAAPLAVTAAAGAAAKRGIILKSGESIQSAKDIKIIVFDKTGTLTIGKPQIVEADISDEYLKIAAALEMHSSHPLANAVIDFAKNKNLYEPNIQFKNINEKPGSGITAELNGKIYFIGRPLSFNENYGQLRSNSSIIELRENDLVIGFLAAADKIRADAETTITLLKKAGILPVLATGDNPKIAAAIAAQAGITEFYADLQPAQKLELIRKYQMQNKKVAMIGDGINDAAALKIADISIAVGGGADISLETADIILVNSELTAIIDALNISKRASVKIKQNLFWAFFYNIIAIPLALSGLLHPLIAEAAMFASSINIIINSQNQ